MTLREGGRGGGLRLSDPFRFDGWLVGWLDAKPYRQQSDNHTPLHPQKYCECISANLQKLPKSQKCCAQTKKLNNGPVK